MGNASTQSKLQLAVIIPALHRPDLTARAIRSFEQQGLRPEDYELVIIENDANSGPVLPDPLPARVRRISLPENRGFTGAVNAGLSASTAEYVLLLNNDVELAPGSVSKLTAAFEADPRAAIAFGKLLKATDRNVLDGAGDALLLGGGAYRLGHGDIDQGQFDNSEPIAGCGAALLVRRSVLDQIGGVDDSFFAYLDDMDLALRVRLCGHALRYVPDARAYHTGSATLGEPLHPKTFEWITRNQILLTAKNYPAGLFFRLSSRILIFQTLWLARAIRERRFGAWMRGIAGALVKFKLSQRRAVQKARKIRTAELLAMLAKSEAQIAAWQKSLAREHRSRLLSIYFALCGAPKV